jgi:large subunit ribosomal protein L5
MDKVMGEYTPRLQDKYKKAVVPALMKEFSFENQLEVPRLTKVSINMGLGMATQNPKIIETAVVELAAICGQKPVVTRAKKSIATFKLREGQPIGAAVTLRKDRMWEFVDRLFTLALPRVRDFRGMPTKSFDGRGNYTMGIREQIIFSEIDYEKIDKIKGMSITFTTTARTDEQGRALLAALGLPFRKATTT